MSRRAASPIRRARTTVIGRIGRSERASHAVRRAAARRARNGGVDAAIVGSILDARLPLDRALQLYRWSTAVARGDRSLPRHFDPGDHLVDPAARRAAAALIRRQAGDAPADPRLSRALIHVDDDVTLAVTGTRVADDLRRRLEGRAAHPHDRELADPVVQRELVATITECLDAAGIRAFLMSGTLLGFHRDGRFLASDYDVDLGVLPGLAVERINDLLVDLPYRVTIEDERVAVIHPSGVSADVFTHEERDGCWWHSTRIHTWWNTPFELERAEFEGVPVWVPSDPTRYLSENYGRWSARPAFYDMSFDTPNRVYRRGPEALRFLHHRCITGIETGDRWTVESAARELRDEFGVDITDLLSDSGLLER